MMEKLDDLQMTIFSVSSGTLLLLSIAQFALFLNQKDTRVFIIRIPSSLTFVGICLVLQSIVSSVPGPIFNLPCYSFGFPSILITSALIVCIIERLFLQYISLQITLDGLTEKATYVPKDEEADLDIASGMLSSSSLRRSGKHILCVEKFDRWLYQNRGRFHSGSCSVTKRIAIPALLVVALSGMVMYGLLEPERMKDAFYSENCQNSLKSVFLFESSLYLISGILMLTFVVTPTMMWDGFENDPFWIRGESLKASLILLWMGIYLLLIGIAGQSTGWFGSRPIVVTYAVHYLMLSQFFLWFMMGNVSRMINKYINFTMDRLSLPGGGNITYNEESITTREN